MKWKQMNPFEIVLTAVFVVTAIVLSIELFNAVLHHDLRSLISGCEAAVLPAVLLGMFPSEFGNIMNLIRHRRNGQHHRHRFGLKEATCLFGSLAASIVLFWMAQTLIPHELENHVGTFHPTTDSVMTEKQGEK